MMIRKGPFGQFAVEEIADPECISNYAMEIIDSDDTEHFLPVYPNRTYEGIELAFDFSGLISINDFTNTTSGITAQRLKARRKSVGDLFLSIHHMIDMLINPSLILIDPRHIFTDSTGSSVRICCLPLMTDTPNKLSSIDTHSAERLLRSSFFSEVLSENEITTLVYAINNNDEELFIRTSSSIRNTQLISANSRKINDDNLKYILIMTVSSLGLYFINTTLSLIAGAASAVFLLFEIHTLLANNTVRQTDDKSLILFEDSGKHGLNCAFLESYAPVDGSIIRYAVYQDLTTIGSDRFLSDLYINSNLISPIHAQIFLTEDTVYLSDCSTDNTTYIDDKRITHEVKHEIKNGQKITFGDVDFKLSISL